VSRPVFRSRTIALLPLAQNRRRASIAAAMEKRVSAPTRVRTAGDARRSHPRSAAIVAFGWLVGLSAMEAEPASAKEPIVSPIAAPSSGGYRAMLEKEARRAGIPMAIADAVTSVESGYDPSAIGSSGEIGLMQVLPSTARMLGFSGSAAELSDPATNIHYGVTYLAGAWRLAAGDLCTAVMKYRAGHGETRFSRRSVDYCLAVRAKLAARGHAVTGVVPVATFGDSATRSAAARTLAVSRCRHACLAGAQQRPLDLSALNASLDQLAAQASANMVRMR
jgi:soluble lytic murein transglycosylase-like protein